MLNRILVSAALYVLLLYKGKSHDKAFTKAMRCIRLMRSAATSLFMKIQDSKIKLSSVKAKAIKLEKYMKNISKNQAIMYFSFILFLSVQTNAKDFENFKNEHKQGVEKLKMSYKIYEKEQQADFADYKAKRDSAFTAFLGKEWQTFLKVPDVSLPTSPDSLEIKTIEISRIKPDENPNIEIINALLRAGVNETQAINIALEIIDSLGIDEIKEGQSIGIASEKDKKANPIVVSYKVDSEAISTLLHGKTKYKYVENTQKPRKNDCIVSEIKYIFPLKGTCRKTSSFGMRSHPILKQPKMHQGVDYATAAGSIVYSIADGEVIESAFNKVSGNYVVIRHKDGLTSHYCHLQKNGIVAKGTKVAAGQNIGWVGSTGLSTGPHLHLGIKKNGIWQDPEKVLGIKLRSKI